MSLPQNKTSVKNFNGFSVVLITLLIVIVCSAISVALIYGLAAPKSSYRSEINVLINTIDHLKDGETTLNNLASNQNSVVNSNVQGINTLNANVNKIQSNLSSVQAQANTLTTQSSQLSSQLNNVSQTVTNQGNSIGTLNSNVAAITTSVSSLTTSVGGLNTSVGSLTTSVSSLNTSVGSLTTTVKNMVSGLQLSPTISASSTTGGTGYITLALNSSTVQTVAFQIEFIPSAASNQLASGTTMDGILQNLYSSPPIQLNEGSSNGTSVRGDYDVFWNGSNYQVGEIIFVTQGTNLSIGTQTKTIYFTYNPTAISYNVVITPVYESINTSTGANASAW